MINDTLLKVLGLTVIIFLCDVSICSFLTWILFRNVKDNIEEVGFIVNTIFFCAILSAFIIMCK